MNKAMDGHPLGFCSGGGCPYISIFVTGQSRARAVKLLRIWVKNSSQRVRRALSDSSCLVRACVSDGHMGWLARLEAQGETTAKGQGLAYTQAFKCLRRGKVCTFSLSLSLSLSKQAPCFNSPMQQQLSHSHSPSERVHPGMLRMLPHLSRLDTEQPWSPLQACAPGARGELPLGQRTKHYNLCH